MREKMLKLWDVYVKNVTLVFSALCLGAHLFFLFFFYKTGIIPLFIINIGSVITYIIVFFIKGPNKKENQLFVMHIELIVFSIISSIILSFENGFFLYSFPLPLTSFIEFKNKRRGFIFLSVIIGMIMAIPLSLWFEPVFAEYRTIMKPYNYSFLLFSIILVMLHFPFTTMFVMKEEAEIANEIRFKSEHDPLTGVRNRESFNQYLAAANNKGDISGSVIMFDIDDFKKINDTYGHDIGDVALKVISVVAQSQIRNTDIIVRWGGEEFVILIEGINLDQAIEKAEDIRLSIERTPYHEDKHLTVSVGVAEIAKGESIENTVKRADDNLYKSKAAGKNRVTA